MLRLSPRSSLVALGILLTLALTACSSGSSTTSPPAAGTTAAVTATAAPAATNSAGTVVTGSAAAAAPAGATLYTIVGGQSQAKVTVNEKLADPPSPIHRSPLANRSFSRL